MIQWRAHITVLLITHVNAQNTSNSEPDVVSPVRPGPVAVIGVFSVALLLTCLLLAFAKCCNPLDAFNRNTNHQHQNFQSLRRTRSRFSGIDKAVIESLPFFRFSSLKGSKEGLECAVCLSKFDDTEVLRLLPNCRHAFHMNCIDKWLESHSSCPLCRYKFDVKDLKNFTYSNSKRYLQSPSDLTEDSNLQLIVQREQEHEESLVQERNTSSEYDWKILHKVNHKIIVSDVVIKHRWSDVNSSDMLLLNSQMIGETSNDRFSPMSSSRGKFHRDFPSHENMMKIKEEIERKRLHESSNLSNIYRSQSVSTSSLTFTSYNESSSAKLLSSQEKRSVPEIINTATDPLFGLRTKSQEDVVESSSGKEERIRRLWLSIARRTVQWFAVRERNPHDLRSNRHISNA